MTIGIDRDILIEGVKDTAQERIAGIVGGSLTLGTAFVQENRGAVQTIPGDIAIVGEASPLENQSIFASHRPKTPCLKAQKLS